MDRFVNVKRQTADSDDVPAPAAKKASPSSNHLHVTDEERAFLMEHGFLVKLNVIPEEDCEKAQTAFEEAMKKLNPSAASTSPQHWARSDFPANVHGIQEMGKLAHLECIKAIRLHPNVVAVWRSLLRTDDVVSSWDRVNYMPAEMKDSPKAWHHTDVDPAFARRPDVAGYVPTQSYVQVSRTSSVKLRTQPMSGGGHEAEEGAADPCIVLWEHSNLAHAEYFRRKGANFKLKAKNWHIYEPEVVAEWETDGKAYLPAAHPARARDAPFPMRRLEVRAPRGAMVFWLSTTAHMNTAGKSPLPRFVVYSCFGPARLLTKKDRENFWKAMAQQRCTTHWPCAGEVRLFAKTPHLFSAERVAAYRAMEDRLPVPQLTFTAAEKALLPKPV